MGGLAQWFFGLLFGCFCVLVGLCVGGYVAVLVCEYWC